jgi:hypothetical protein
MNSKFDIISSLLKSFDRFLVKLSDVDPEKVRTQKRYLILTFLFYYFNNFTFWLLGIDAGEVRRRMRWQSRAGIPFDPENFPLSKMPFRK